MAENTESLNIDTLIQALKNKQLFNHPVTGFQVIETHISFVLLTGEYAYKIKKPVNLGFVNFTKLEDRFLDCKQELLLNLPLASPIYLEVVAIHGSPTKPNFSSMGEIIEYAVKMRQFNQDDKFDNLCNLGKLSEAQIVDIARQIAQFHQTTEIAAESTSYGSPGNIEQAMLENFDVCQQMIAEQAEQSDPIKSLQILKSWSCKMYHNRRTFMTHRKKQGFVRNCHGDLHLGNIAEYNGKNIIFDRLEFNADFRFIDTINEIAFLIMDLEMHGQFSLANLFLNEYLTHTGDYEGLELLNFYKIYRAMVRAKVALLTPAPAHEKMQTFLRYIEYAVKITTQPSPLLVIMSGVSGSGKSELAREIAKGLQAIHIRSDIERKRLYSHIDNKEELYTSEKSFATYKRLLRLSSTLLQLGFKVIVDATFLIRNARKEYYDYASENQIPMKVIQAIAPIEILQQRITTRMQQNSSESDADLAVLEKQLTNAEPFSLSEQPYLLTVDTTKSIHANTADIMKIMEVM